MQHPGTGAVPSQPGTISTSQWLSRDMRLLLYAAGVLVFLAGLQLFAFSERTEEFFAWTIDPAATAAFLGAGYWAAVAVELLAATESRWERARVAVPAVFVFTTLTLIATLLHLDMFHFDAPDALTRAVTWVWLAIYMVVPVIMGVLWWRQAGRDRAEPGRLAPLPEWTRAVLGVYGVSLLAIGGFLFVLPLPTAESLWPWALAELSARAVGAWLISMGVLSVHALIEDDWVRLRPAAGGLLLLGAFQLLAMVRYRFEFDWGAGRTWVYVLGVIGLFVLGIYSWLRVEFYRHVSAFR